MGATASLDDAQVGAVTDRVVANLKGRGIDLDLVPKKDELSETLRSMEEFADTVMSKVDDKIARSFDDKLKVGLEAIGFDAEQFRTMWDGLKKADARGAGIGARNPDPSNDGQWRRDAYKKVGRAAAASVFHAAHMPLPKEYQDYQLQRAQLGGTDTKGGVTIPDLRLDEWAILARDGSLAFRMFDVVDMEGELTLIVPALTGDLETGLLTNEGTTAASEVDADFASEADSSQAVAAMGAWVSISRKIPPQRFMKMEGQIGRLLVRAAGWRQDKWVFNDTTGPFTSMIAAATGAHTMDAPKNTFEESAYVDWSKLQFAIDPNHIGNGVYLMHPTVFGHVTRLVDDDNRPLFVTGWVAPQGMVPNSPVTDGAPAVLLNRPCFLSTTMPALSDSAADEKFALYFDPQFGTIGLSQPPFTEVDDSQDRKKFMRHIYIFNVFAFKYSQGSAAAALITAAS